MEDKQKFPFHKGYGKMLTASLLILTGLLLFARNSGMITEEYFNLLVAWHSLFIIHHHTPTLSFGRYFTIGRHLSFRQQTHVIPR